jgi:hypothetical protein
MAQNLDPWGNPELGLDRLQHSQWCHYHMFQPFHNIGGVVGTSVCVLVGRSVMGASVGASVGAAVGSSVGAIVGARVGARVGIKDGFFVGYLKRFGQRVG